MVRTKIRLHDSFPKKEKVKVIFMKKMISLILLLFCLNTSFAQGWQLPKIDVGIALRLKPYQAEFTINPLFQNGKYIPYLDTKSRFYVGITQKIKGKNNLFATLSSYITYHNISNQTEAYKFKRDHFVDLINIFKSKKQRPHLYLGAGIGYMKCGTNYTYVQKGINNGQIFIFNPVAKGTQRFLAERIIIGVQKHKYNGSFIINNTQDNEGAKLATFWTELKFSYTIDPFKKKK